LPTVNGLGFMAIIEKKLKIPEDLKRCVEFHGHICPGLIYGYLVAKKAMKLMELRRAIDEEVVASRDLGPVWYKHFLYPQLSRENKVVSQTGES